MVGSNQTWSERNRQTIAQFQGLILLGLPIFVLLLGLLNCPSSQLLLLSTGVGCITLMAMLLAMEYGLAYLKQRQAIVIPYVGAATWLLLVGLTEQPIGKVQFGLLLLLVVAIVVHLELNHSNLARLRKSRRIVDALAHRTKWPSDIRDCLTLPEVLELRSLVQDDPSPALALTRHPALEGQVAALGALKDYPYFRSSVRKYLLHLATKTTSPIVRAATVRVLSQSEDENTLDRLVVHLRDEDHLVRMATSDSLLMNAEQNWLKIRGGYREAIIDPRFARDGAFPCRSRLPDQALNDFLIWAGEIGSTGQRATMTLVEYFRRMIKQDRSDVFVERLNRQLLDPLTPSAVRVEVGYMLRDGGYLRLQHFEKLLESNQPGPLRLLAVEALLISGWDPRADQVLREIAAQPNRELAVAAAVIIQKYLRVDLGLPLNSPPPPAHSREAQEVTRRVMQWASGAPIDLSAAPPIKQNSSVILRVAVPQSEMGTPLPYPEESPSMVDTPTDKMQWNW
jgi:hypothetical protein